MITRTLEKGKKVEMEVWTPRGMEFVKGEVFMLFMKGYNFLTIKTHDGAIRMVPVANIVTLKDGDYQ